MIILESIHVAYGPNVEPENAKITANWVEFDDVTGEQLSFGHQEIWIEHKDFDGDEWDSKPADLKESDKKQWKNLDPQVRNVVDNLFDKITKVIEDAVVDGDITPHNNQGQGRPAWMDKVK